MCCVAVFCGGALTCFDVCCSGQLTCDRWFGALKQRLHGKQGCGADTIEQLLDVCNNLPSADGQEHKGCSSHHRLDDTNCPTFFNISGALAPFFTALENIDSYHEFWFEASNPGHVKVTKGSHQAWKTIDLRSAGYDIAKVRAVDIERIKVRGPTLPPARVKYLCDRMQTHIPASSKARFKQEVEWLATPALASDTSGDSGGAAAGDGGAAEAFNGSEAEERVVLVRLPADLDGVLVRMRAPGDASTRQAELWCHNDLCDTPEEYSHDNLLLGCDWCAHRFHASCFPPGASDPAVGVDDDLCVACDDCFLLYCIK